MTIRPLIELWKSQAVVLLRNGHTNADLMRALAESSAAVAETHTPAAETDTLIAEVDAAYDELQRLVAEALTRRTPREKRGGPYAAPGAWSYRVSDSRRLWETEVKPTIAGESR